VRASGALLLWSFLAVITGCGRRVDPRDRGEPITGVARSAVEPTQKAKPPRPSSAAEPEGPLLRHVTADALFASVRQLKKKGVVLNVWATWCGPCREELPMLHKVSKAYAERGIAVLPLSVDDPESEPQLIELMRSIGFEPPYYVAKPPLDPLKAALYTGWPGNIPVSFLLDGNAARRYFFNAEVYEEELTPKLDAMLSGTLVDGQSNFGVAAGKEL
jgi:cytochrome c biogenesis protein CcmG, thiol:disulfide interchange protein DsbE